MFASLPVIALGVIIEVTNALLSLTNAAFLNPFDDNDI